MVRAAASTSRQAPLELFDANRDGQQLFLADLFWRPGDRTQGRPQGTGLGRGVRRPPRPVEAIHPVAWRQLVLFPAERDLAQRGYRDLPPPAHRQLAEALDNHARDYARRHGWRTALTWTVRTGIRVLLTLQDTPGAAIADSEIDLLTQVHLPSRHVREVLEDVGMVEHDRAPTVERWFQRKSAELPERMREELAIWRRVMLEGSASSPRSRPRTAASTALYLSCALPALRRWTHEGHQSLREVTREDILDALPNDAADRDLVGKALRSIFKILKGQRVLFVNPTARIRTWSRQTKPPVPLPTQQLTALVSAEAPDRAALAALIAFHGLSVDTLRNLKLTDLRDHRLHLPDRTVVLAAPVTQRLTAYLAHRAAKWPATVNPHLFITMRTANRTQPASHRWIRLTLGIAPRELRDDRILHEAIATHGDARRLADLFGLSVPATRRYLGAAEPITTPNHATR